MVINDLNDGDIIVCRITSQIFHTIWDLEVVHWKEAGLKIPSVISVQKFATLDKEMAESILGRIDETTLNLNLNLIRPQGGSIV